MAYRPPRFTAAEQIDLVIRAKAGDLRSRNLLAESYTPAIRLYVSRRIKNHECDFDDAMQNAAFAVLDAIRLFDPNRGIAFSTYCIRCIMMRVARYCKDRRRANRFRPAALVMPNGEVIDVFDPQPDVDEAVADAEIKRNTRETYRKALLWLRDAHGDRMAEVVAMRLEGVTLTEIGSRFGITKERVRQIELKAIQMLRAQLRVAEVLA